MAMQSGMSLSKIIIILAGAGYTGTFLLKNGKLSDVLGELQSLLKSGDKTDSEFQYSDAVSSQVRRLAMEVRQLASGQQITVLSGNSGQIGNMSSLVMPAVALGALGYGYMWWKGLKFSDLLYVSKRNMENAVTNLTKRLEHVSDSLAATKRHLTQRIENLDGKLDVQKEISKLIKGEVTEVRGDLSQIGCDLDALQRMVSGLDGKICTLEDKQDLANVGVLYLCNLVDGKKMKRPEILQSRWNVSGRARGYLISSEKPSLMGLKEIAETLISVDSKTSVTDVPVKDN